MEEMISCPVCCRKFQQKVVEDHVNKCLFLNSHAPNKRELSLSKEKSSTEKRIKLDVDSSSESTKSNGLGNPPQDSEDVLKLEQNVKNKGTKLPLSEVMRPSRIEDVIGQNGSFGTGSMLRSMLLQRKIPNMILWGPPGCGKTSIANVVAAICKEENNLRFVKLSATMSGINDVKEVVKIAKNESQFKKQTVLFMDEIHRFNKLQQDTFLPHVENGTIILIGATTENPSFSLNNALLSRCRVIVMEKLSSEDIIQILERALISENLAAVIDNDEMPICINGQAKPKFRVQRLCLKWLSEVCDGDARVALSALEMTLQARADGASDLITLRDVSEGIKKSHILYDRAGEEHYNIISAIHKSIRASDDNAALYWTVRALESGEDPLFITRRLVRAASEDIGLADPNALVEAIACLTGCQNIGMPECNVLIAQCAVRLARAPKSQEIYQAMKRCQSMIAEQKGPSPPVPLHLRNATTSLLKQMGYGNGYNTEHRDKSGLTYMPQGLENEDFFKG